MARAVKAEGLYASRKRRQHSHALKGVLRVIAIAPSVFLAHLMLQ
jgi:hypothetical protein